MLVVAIWVLIIALNVWLGRKLGYGEQDGWVALASMFFGVIVTAVLVVMLLLKDK